MSSSGLPNTRQTLVNTSKGKEPLKRLRGLRGPVCPQEEEAQGILIDLYKYLIKGIEEQGAALLLGVLSDKTR